MAEKMSAEEMIGVLRDFERGDWSACSVNETAARAADIITALQREADEARAEASRLREALEPFADFALVSVNATGWINRAGNELIQDWFHPADFFKAFKAHRGSGPIPTVAEMPAALSKDGAG